jgi:hypothetical protein
MEFVLLHKYYWFIDGSIKSFHIDVQNSSASIDLVVRRYRNGKIPVQVKEEDLVTCTLRLTFHDLIQVSLLNKFPTQGYYLNFSTSESSEEVGISFNVHDSSNHVYEKDNWIIKAKRVAWKEVE